jgi:hypothetical protein
MRRWAVALALLLIPSSAWAIQATLNWSNPPTSTATGIRVERGQGPDPVTFTTQQSLPPTATTLNQTGLVLGTRYCYRVVPFNTLGDASAVIACGSPDAPLPVGGLTIIFAP